MRTVVALYDDLSTARQVVQDLDSSGFDRDQISVVANNSTGDMTTMDRSGDMVADEAAEGAATGATAGAIGGGALGVLAGLGALAIPGIGPVVAAGPLLAGLAGAGIGAAAGGITGALVDAGIPDDDADLYAEGVRRGGTLVTASVDDSRVNDAVSIMNRYGPMDINDRSTGWRDSGYSRFDSTAAPLPAETITQERETYRERAASRPAQTVDTDQMSVPIVEEDLRVGKRTVERGGVRVHTRMEEIPVEEQVTLREEHVVVDRRPVDRPLTDADMSSFQEGTIELTERSEEAVVSKEARVVEEVVIGKEASERVETVSDTVRRTDVDVEEINTPARVSGTTTTDYSTDYRSNFDTTYSGRGYRYEDYEPAYRYGSTLASDTRYSGRNWSDVETDVRRDWESRGGGQGAWEDVKDAVRYGWDRVTGRR